MIRTYLSTLIGHRYVSHVILAQGGRGVGPIRITMEMQFKKLPNSKPKKLHFSIYQAFARNFMVNGEKSSGLWQRDYEELKTLSPVYVPGFAGAIRNEDMYRPLAWQRLISEGRHNEVIRNMMYQISKNPADWKSFCGSLKLLFSIKEMQVPFDENIDPWLTAQYSEIEDVTLDIISAGAGFLQVVQLLAFIYLHKPKTLLLDEPDAHLHHDLQESVMRLLRTLTQQRNIQTFLATHSPSFIDAVPLQELYVIDKAERQPKRFSDDSDVASDLKSRGISLAPTKLTEALRLSKVIFVEGLAADYEKFLKLFGPKVFADFSIKCKGLMAFAIGEANRKAPFDAIALFEQLLRTKLQYLYIRDKDFLTKEEVAEQRKGNARWRCLDRRNRENYFIEPKVLARLIKKKLKEKKIPKELTEGGIANFFLKCCKDNSSAAQANLITLHELSLRGTDDHRRQGMERLLKSFNKEYTLPLEKRAIPHFFSDGKALLREFREMLGKNHQVHFSDEEIVDEFQPSEIPPDLKALISDIHDLF